MQLDGQWTQVFSQRLQVQVLAGEQRGYIPIPPFYVPAIEGDYSLSTDAVAVDCFSQASRSSWWLGVWVQVETNLPALTVPAISPRHPVPINRGALIIEIPEWARAGFQLSLEVPYWYEETTIEVYRHDGP